MLSKHSPASRCLASIDRASIARPTLLDAISAWLTGQNYSLVLLGQHHCASIAWQALPDLHCQDQHCLGSIAEPAVPGQHCWASMARPAFPTLPGLHCPEMPASTAMCRWSSAGRPVLADQRCQPSNADSSGVASVYIGICGTRDARCKYLLVFARVPEGHVH